MAYNFKIFKGIKYICVSIIIEWLFPKKCFGCGKGDKYLCSLCENKLEKGLLIVKKEFEGIIYLYKYDGLVKKIVEKIKYEFVSDAIKEMAELMAKKLILDYPNIVKHWQKEKYTLIAIPLYKNRENWRGFNQSEKVVESLSKVLNLSFDNEILFRNLKSKNQATIKDRQLRRKNINNVFIISDKKEIPKKVILVDDVITSGATMTAALRTLKSSGVQSLWGLGLCGVLK